MRPLWSYGVDGANTESRVDWEASTSRGRLLFAELLPKLCQPIPSPFGSIRLPWKSTFRSALFTENESSESGNRRCIGYRGVTGSPRKLESLGFRFEPRAEDRSVERVVKAIANERRIIAFSEAD